MKGRSTLDKGRRSSGMEEEAVEEGKEVEVAAEEEPHSSLAQFPARSQSGVE